MVLFIWDAEISEIRKLKRLIDWEEFGFLTIHSAYHKEKARQMAENLHPNLIICDLTNISKDWLELLFKCREQNPSAELLLIGKNMEKEYFRKALNLGAFEYLEKPVVESELVSALHLFREKELHKQEAKKEIQGGKYWKQNHTLIQEMFWKNLCLNRITGGFEKIEEEAMRMDAGLDMDASYSAILIAMKNQDEMWRKWGEDVCQAAIRNLARALIKKAERDSKVMVIYSRVVVILEEDEFDTAEENCNLLAEECKKELGAELFCYISEPVFCEKLADIYTGLLAYSRDDVLRQKQVTYVKNRKIEDNEKIIIPKLWGDILYSGTPLMLVQEVRFFLTLLARKGQLNETNMRIFQQDMLQLFFSYMEKKELSAHELYDNTEIFKLYKSAISSVDDMCHWVESCTDYITRGISDKHISAAEKMVADVKEYIRTHLKEELSVKQIADNIHLSSDYMTKLFKKETGNTVKEYIIRKRMERAKEMLQTTKKTVSDISMEAGYDNLSYFIRQFRYFYGVTPKQLQMKKSHMK